MADIVPRASLPTSVGGLKNAGGSALRIVGGLAVVVIGVGVFLKYGLPLLSRVPFIGDVAARGASVIPGQTAQSGSDQYGRRF